MVGTRRWWGVERWWGERSGELDNDEERSLTRAAGCRLLECYVARAARALPPGLSSSVPRLSVISCVLSARATTARRSLALSAHSSSHLIYIIIYMHMYTHTYTYIYTIIYVIINVNRIIIFIYVYTCIDRSHVHTSVCLSLPAAFSPLLAH